MRAKKLKLRLEKNLVLLMGSNLTLGGDIPRLLDGVELLPKAHFHSSGVLLDLALLPDDHVAAVVRIVHVHY